MMSTFHLNLWFVEKVFTQHDQRFLKLKSDYFTEVDFGQ